MDGAKKKEVEPERLNMLGMPAPEHRPPPQRREGEGASLGQYDMFVKDEGMAVLDGVTPMGASERASGE